MEIGVLIVSDNEHDMGDDEVASSEVAEVGEHMGKTLGTQIQLAGPWKLLIPNYSYYICILLITVLFICKGNSKEIKVVYRHLVQFVPIWL